MLSFQQDFDNSKKEIENYLKFVQQVDNNQISMSTLKQNPTDTIDIDLLKIIKANAFMMLYNLVESTIKNSLWEIFEAIKGNSVSYVELRDEIKHIILLRKTKFDFKTKDDTIAKQVKVIIDKVISNFSEYFPTQKHQIYFEAGNLNIDRINDTLKSYGLSPVNQNHDNQKEAFSIILRNRNNLAHGDQTFSECGRKYTYIQLEEYKENIFEYLDRVLQAVKDFISNSRYKV